MAKNYLFSNKLLSKGTSLFISAVGYCCANRNKVLIRSGRQHHSQTLYLSSTKESNNYNTKLEMRQLEKSSRNILVSQGRWKILKWSSNNLLHGSFNAISRTEIRQSCVIYIIDSSEFRWKRNWKLRNLNFPISFDLFSCSIREIAWILMSNRSFLSSITT